jgi:lambda family phage portal protein
MAILDRIRQLVSGTSSAPVERPSPGSSFMRGGRGVTFNGWRPSLRDTQDDIADAWDNATARAIDVIQNSGWLSGAIDQAVANTVGTGLRLKAMPENTTFGMTNEEALAWGRKVEARFELWTRNPNECDIEAKRTFGQMQAAAFRSWIATGEILAELPWRTRTWTRYGTKVRLLSPHKLSRKSDTMARLVNGVYHDADGMPIAYLSIKKDNLVGEYEVPVRARDRYGRQRVIFIFDGMPGTARGISPLTPALQVARQFDQLADATLMASIMQTLFAATITSDEPTEQVMQGLLTPQEQARMAATGISPMEAYLDMVGGFYDNVTLNVGINGRIAHLFPGQELKFHRSEHPSSDYKDFSMHLLRELARCLGLTYESTTGDYDGATYSSVRMATGEIFAITKLRRQNVVAPFCQAAYEAWLEEEIENGGIEFPGGIEAFYLNRTAACRADWRGTPKPQADDLKTAKAHEVWRRMGVISDAMIANDLGVDIEDVYAQRASEAELRDVYGLTDPMLMAAEGGMAMPVDGADDAEDDPEDEDMAADDDDLDAGAARGGVR